MKSLYADIILYSEIHLRKNGLIFLVDTRLQYCIAFTPYLFTNFNTVLVGTALQMS